MSHSPTVCPYCDYTIGTGAANHPICVEKRIAELEAENAKLARVIYDEAHRAATLGSGSTGWLRGRFMSISNALNAAIGRTQSSHGDQYDGAGSIVKSDPHTNS